MNNYYAFNEPEAGDEPVKAMNAVHDDCQVYQASAPAPSSIESKDIFTQELVSAFHQARMKAVTEFVEAGRTALTSDGYTPHASP